MRRLVAALVPLLVLSLAPSGCGDGSEQLKGLLRGRIGEIQTLTYTGITEDGDKTYREDIALDFPATYSYRLYDYPDGRQRLLSAAAQSGMETFRARAVTDEAGAVTSLEIDRSSNVPPIRCAGAYMSIYHLAGNGDYYQSLLSLIDSGTLEVKGLRDLEGMQAWQLRTAPGLQPDITLWLDRDTGLPLRKELVMGGSRTIVFRYQDTAVNQGWTGEPFPPEITGFDLPPESAKESSRNGGCVPLEMDGAEAVLGFAPLLPALEGFEVQGCWWRDPRRTDLIPPEDASKFPEGFREFYLVLRNGPRQAEIRQTPFDRDFGFYTTGFGVLTGAYLSVQESWGEDFGNAAYSAAIDCQELHMLAGGIEIVVTGDLTRAEMESLAAQFSEAR